LAFHRARSAVLSPDSARHIRRRPVAAVVKGARFLRWPGRERRWLETQKISGYNVARRRGPRPATARWRPRFVLPGDDGALRVQTHTLVDGPGIAKVLPGHLILAAELHAYRFAHCLRKHQGVVAYRVHAIQPIASRTAPENNMYILWPETENHGA